jgi:phosphatidylglycerophosphate synthase
MSIKQHIPNILTISRAVLGVAFPFVPTELWIPFFVIATVTEVLDGQLSRLWDAVSLFGRIADPIADKIFIFAMFVTFVLQDMVEPWEVAAIASRDVVIMLGGSWVFLVGDRGEFEHAGARIPGKIATAFQFGLLLWLLIDHSAPNWLVVLTGVVSGFAAIDYLWFYMHEVRGDDPRAPDS